MPTDVITVREAAKRLGRTPHTIEHALRMGDFPVGTCFKTPSKRHIYIIPRDAFEAFLQGKVAGRPTTALMRDGFM